MSRKRNSSSGDIAIIIALAPVLIVMALIATIIQFVIENIVIILICIAVIGLIAGICVFANRATARKIEADSKKQMLLDIVNAREVQPVLTRIPTSKLFSNREEEYINMLFRDFLKRNNEVVLAQSHVDYLVNKSNALRALGRTEEASLLDAETHLAKTALSSAQSKRGGSFESKCISFLCRSTEIKNAFIAFASKIPNCRLPLIGEFFQSPQIKIADLGETRAFLFTPAYMIAYSGPSQTLKLIQYKDVNISSLITTEILKGTLQPNDEIEHIGYLYETKDGSRDLRYSWQNNPSYTYVYRGTVTISSGGLLYKQKCNNKSTTKGFENSLNAYRTLLSGKYSLYLPRILAHDDELLAAGSIENYNTQQNAEKRLKGVTVEVERERLEKAIREHKVQADVEKERLEREIKAKAEKERLEREIKAKAEKERLEREIKAQREKEQAEREAAELEKQRKDNLLRNLTIVDGTLTGWYGSDRVLELPEGLVTTIGTAFRWKKSLESVKLPHGITSILSNAFYRSSSLWRVIIPETVSEIGEGAFWGCTSLTEISIPSGIKVISARMFGECSSLETLIIPAGVKRIERGAFFGCGNLKELILPDGVTSVEDDAFENCISLKRVVFPDSVSNLGKNIFNGCSSLEHVILGNGIKRIPDDCFNSLGKLQDVTVSSDILEIGDRAFKNCQNLSKIICGKGIGDFSSKDKNCETIKSDSLTSTEKNSISHLERIGESAFENCVRFCGLELRNGLRFVGDYAFANCRSIESVNIPASINSIGMGAFSGCVRLSSVIGFEKIDWHKKHCFVGAPWLTTQSENGFVIFDGFLEAYTGSDLSVIIPQSVKTIGRSAFEGNAYITSVVIPEGVDSIDELAFANCKRLKSVRIADSVVHIEDNVFANDNGIVIQCYRGSAASSFRIRNKIAGEYISKQNKYETEKRSTRRNKGGIEDGLSGLSEEELQVIMEMRRKKLAKKKADGEKTIEPERTDYKLIPFDNTKVSIKLRDDNRRITNNIFSLQFVQNESVSSTKTSAEYETFVIDTYGQVISNIITISANKSGDDLIYKVTYSLSSHESFDKASDYYVILRYRDAGINILSKTRYQISIEFSSDFDF